ncbi:MAG TPA: hypothetical protein VGP64_13885 [Polyangia bacterium]|jgi:hypothetical protein
MSTEKGPPLFGLPLGGVAFGALWLLGAFGSLFYCFAFNYVNKASVPGIELAVANAAMAGEQGHAETHAPTAAPQP